MKVLHTIQVPWAAYSVMFSRDGTRLAVGGGSWYGHGGILLTPLDALEHGHCFRTACLPGCEPRFPEEDEFTASPSAAPAVSGVCFSDDDRHLAASMWSSSQHFADSWLFNVAGLELHPCAALPSPHEFSLSGTPTGVLLHGSYVFTRIHRAYAEQVLQVDIIPSDLQLCAAAPPQHLTHSRLIVVQKSVVTAFTDSRSIVIYQEPRAVPGTLAFCTFDQRGLQVHEESVRGGSRVTAIVAGATGDSFVTGGSDGELHRWEWEHTWRQSLLCDASGTSQLPERRIPRANYKAASVVGLAFLHDARTLVSVTAGGDLAIHCPGRSPVVHRLPEEGTPRSLAAHPHKPWVAIGVKRGNFGNPQSAVLIVEVD